jgi:hypothetical protein
MIKRLVLYPFIFAVYPLFALFAFNVDQVEASNVIRPLIVVLFFAILIYLLFFVIFKNWHKAGLGTSLILIIFFSYGHVYNLLSDQTVGGFEPGRHRYLILSAGLVLAGGLYIIWKKIRNPEGATPVLNVVAAVMLILPFYGIASFYLEDKAEISPESAAQSETSAPLEEGQLPDIYYIVLDSYARQDILEAIFQHDNSQFITELSDLGFFVADQSRSNYSQTTLSLSSSLNMDYVQAFMDPIDEDNLDKAPLRTALKNSQVREILESMGYKITAFDSTTRMTRIDNADEFLFAKQNNENKENLSKTLNNLGAITPFELIFIESSAGVIFTNMASQCITLQNQGEKTDADLNGERSLPCKLAGWIIPHFDYPYTNLRNNILFTFEKLPNLGDDNTPRFIFAHIIAPHFPFVFGPNGEFSRQTNAFSLDETGGFVGNRQTYIDGYTDELIYVNKRLQETLKQIIANSENPPIIIIQADHGAHANMVAGDPDPLPVPFYKERFAILNAYYLPNCEIEQLYADITPINTFRVVFNSCFGQDFNLLEDISYYSKYNSPYKFIEVTQEIKDSN